MIFDYKEKCDNLYEAEDEDEINLIADTMSYYKRSAGGGGGGSRKARCMSCPACLQADCRTCKYCIDMKKYGGPGVKKQSCEHRPKCHMKERREEDVDKTSGSDKCNSDLDDVESSEDPFDDDGARKYNYVATHYSNDHTHKQFSKFPRNDIYYNNSAKLYSQSGRYENESRCANASSDNDSESLKCNYCEFIGKTGVGLKKHSIRYHRSSYQVSRDCSMEPLVKEKDPSKRKVVFDTWQLQHAPADGSNGNSLKRLKSSANSAVE